MSDTTVTSEALLAAQKVLNYVVDNYEDIEENAEGAHLNAKLDFANVAFDLGSKVMDYVHLSAERAAQEEQAAKAMYEIRFPHIGWDNANRLDRANFRRLAKAALAVVK